MADEKLTIRKSEWLDDWYIIERLEHDGHEWLENTGPNSMAYRRSARFSDADIEGSLAEMQQIAVAIRNRARVSFRRCSVRINGDRAFFSSPRNSTEAGETSLAAADELAAQIENLVAGFQPAATGKPQ